MKGLIDGYTHHPGVHCISTAFSNILRFNGFNITEAMGFGLGDRLGLYYSTMLTGTPILSGYKYKFEERACKRLDIKLQNWNTDDPEKGWIKLLERLKKGIPTMIYADMAFLDYLDFPEGEHFGQHGIVICGYDHEEQTVLVSDTEHKDIKEQSIENLKQARSFKFNKWIDPRNPDF